MKVRFHLTIGYSTADHEEDREFPDDTTQEEIDEELKMWAYNYIEYSARVISAPVRAENGK